MHCLLDAQKTFADLPTLDLDDACNHIKNGGVLIYPTETYCAIGCNPFDAGAVETVYALKKRPRTKPAPIITASMEQAARVADLSCAPGDLLAAFWPGPLTVVLPALAPFVPLLLDAKSHCAIRASGASIARALAKKCDMPLLATSANFSGKPPARTKNELDADLLETCAKANRPCAIFASSENAARHTGPSTIISCEKRPNGWLVSILREGAIDRSALENQNFSTSMHFCGPQKINQEFKMKKTVTCPHCGKPYSAYRNPTPTTDIIIYEPQRGVVIIKRANEPHGYALPGGFIDEGEQAENAAIREALEETGLHVRLSGLLGVYSHPDRDPRQHTLSVVFTAKAENPDTLQAGDDAAAAAFYPLDQLPAPMAFDHWRILEDFKKTLKNQRTLAPIEPISKESAPNSPK